MQTKSGKPLFPIGVGTWGINSTINQNNLSSKYRGVEPVHGNEKEGIEAIRYSISKGQNHIDCAEMYGGFYTDEVVGQALTGLNREDLYIADKLWKTSVPTGMVRATVEEMLKKIGTDYLDLLYIHAPFDDAPWKEAIPQIDELINEGIIRGFGVSNFTASQMEEAMTIAKQPIMANQIHYNVLYKDKVNAAFNSFCHENNIAIVAYRPVERQDVLNNEVIQEIAKLHDATPAQVAIAWLLAKASLPIPKAVQKGHIDENVGAINVTLSDDDLKLLDSI